jgi:hypothetical protein
MQYKRKERNMRFALVLFVVFSLGYCKGDDDSTLFYSKKLVSALKTKETMCRIVNQGSDSLLKLYKSKKTNDKNIDMKISIYQEILDRTQKDTTLEIILANVYKKRFSKEELKELINFFNSKTWQKYEEKKIEIKKEIGIVFQDWYKSMMIKVDSAVIQKHNFNEDKEE